jgi:hypothetical protein
VAWSVIAVAVVVVDQLWSTAVAVVVVAQSYLF